MDTAPKVIVLHPDRQHSLQTALALQSQGYLYKYFTTVYLKKKSISHLLASIAPVKIRQKFLKHQLRGLDDTRVTMFCQKRMLILALISRFLPEDLINKLRGGIIDSFNKKCLSQCLKEKFDVLISYDTLSGDYYKPLKHIGVKLILDMSAPCFKEMYHNFQLDVNRNPNTSRYLKEYLKGKKVKRNLRLCQEELDTYDYYLSASTYTKETLVINNIDASRILVAPYGLTHVNSPIKHEHQGFSCTFVGSVTQQKGCHYIFKIAEMMPEVTFNLVGAYDNSYSTIPKNCILHGYLPFNDIESILQKTDLFLFLSLADGFGFAASEAMAYGIPVICSVYAGVRDLVENSGWIVDPTDICRIKDIITWCMNNSEDVKQRGVLARRRTLCITWSSYGKLLTDFIRCL